MNLSCLGVNFRTAALEVRECVAYSPASAGEFLRSLRAALPTTEVLLLSTCNRTEFYLGTDDGLAAQERLLEILCAERRETAALRDECTRYQLGGAAAARHLLRVASGLDSAILGDVHILGQIKESVDVATAAGTLGPFLRRTAIHAIRAAKQARTQTAIGSGGASIGAAIAAMLEPRTLGPVLIIGAGKIAGDVGRHLAKKNLGPLLFVNRSPERAVKLARECHGEALPWERLADLLAYSAVVIAATAAAAPILDRALLDEIASKCSDTPPLVIDAGVPRNVEAGTRLAVIDIDAIRERQGAALEVRRAAVPVVEEIVDRELAAWTRWCRGLSIEDLVRRLYRDVDTHTREAADVLVGRAGLSANDAERLVRRCFRPLVHEHVRRLREVVSEDSAA